MVKRTGGLGSNIKDVKNEELLDAAFFSDAKEIKESKTKEAPSNNTASSKKLVGKHLQISPDFIKKIKLYAIENDLKEYEVINLALVRFFETE